MYARRTLPWVILLALLYFFMPQNLNGAQRGDCPPGANTANANGTYSGYVTDGSSSYTWDSYSVSIPSDGDLSISYTSTENTRVWFSTNNGNDCRNNRILSSGTSASATLTGLSAGDTVYIQLRERTGGGNTADYAFTLSFAGTSNPPVIDNQSFSVNEDAANGTVVGTVSASGGAPTSFSIVSGNTGNVFQIDNAGEITIADNSNLDYENLTSYTLEIEATNADGSDSADVTVGVNDVAGPTVADQGFSVDEDAANGTVVGTVSTSGGTPDTFSILSGNTGNVFQIDNAGEITVADNSNLDYENLTSYALVVETSNAEGTDTATVTIGVNDVSESTSCPGDVLGSLDGTAVSASQSLSGTIPASTTLYFYFTPTVAGTVQVDSTVSASWNSLFIKDGCGSNLWSDETNTNDKSSDEVSVDANQTIVIALERRYTTDKTYTLDIDFTATVPIVENADDLCYEEPVYSGLFCMDMGVCQGGMNCTTTYTITNQGSGDLTQTEVIYDESSLGGTFSTNCSVDPSGSCSQQSAIDMGAFGMFTQATVFEIDGTVEPDEDTDISTTAMFSGSCFSGDELYATYYKAGNMHRGKIPPCASSVPDETVPTDDTSALDAVCGAFEDMFQTRAPCGGSEGNINFNNAGQLIDNNGNIILDNTDNSLNTCNVNAQTWVENQYETCGDAGDCNASESPSQSLTLNYSNPPESASLEQTPTSATNDVTLSSSTTNLSDAEYNEITTTYYTGRTANIEVSDTVDINSIKMTNGNVFSFTGSSVYNITIGSLGIVNNGSGNTVETDGNPKNIKIHDFTLTSGTTVDLTAAQTIKMDSFEVGYGSTVSLTAPYVNINSFTLDSTGSGDATVEITADYVDIGTLDINNHSSGSTFTFRPYTAGKRILFRTNTLLEGSNSTLLLSSGNYYTGSVTLPGTSDVSAMRALDEDQLINFYVDGDLTPGNNPGINSTGNSGNYGDNPASNFLLFIDGDLNTGGGGTTFNATIYVEGDVTMGNPTYIKGAISAQSQIDVGQGQFTYDQNLSGEWGACSSCAYVQWQYDQYTIAENINYINTTETLTTTIMLPDGPVGYDVTVDYYTVDGTATVGDGDYVAVTNGTATIPAGDTNVTVDIYIWNDAPIELEEDFYVQLTNPQPGTVCLNEHNLTQITIEEQEDSPVCFDDDFEDYALGTGDLEVNLWRALQNPNAGNSYDPQIVDVNGDHRLRLTDDSTNLATVITKDYKFFTEQNLIIVEFDYYAYGGCGGGGLGTYGADGITAVLFDSDVGDSPVPGARGGAMGYAQMTATNPNQYGFEGGWLGLGLDEYGNYSNPNEGKVGGPGFVTNGIAIRGDGDGISGYEYLEGTSAVTPVLAKKTGYGSDGYFSGRYKMTIDARDPSKLDIRLERSITGDEADYYVLISEFDAKEAQYNQGDTPDEVRYAITSGTGGGCNNHEFGWIRLRGNCAAIGGGDSTLVYPTGPFDAWDTFRGDTNGDYIIDDRNISTKIAQKSFSLNIASMDAYNTGIETKEDITVGYQLKDVDSGELLGTYNLFDANTSAMITSNFTIDEAHKRVAVQFTACADHNGTHYLLYPYDETDCTSNPAVIGNSNPNVIRYRLFNSTDLFAARPDTFDIDLQGETLFKAEKDYELIFRAYDGQTTPAPTGDYNESETTSFRLDFNLTDPSLTCPNTSADLSPDVVFADGIVTHDYMFEHVGEYNMTIEEVNGSDYASVDIDDTKFANDPNGISRAITSDMKQIKVVPDHFEVNATMSDYSGANYTYLFDFTASGDANTSSRQMAATLDINVTAVSFQNNTTENYSETCYAKPINVDLVYDTLVYNPSPGLSTVYGFEISSETLGSGSIDAPIAINNIDGIFASGLAELEVKINFDRSLTAPVNPIHFVMTDIDITDTDGVPADAPTLSANDATFLFGRVHAPRYRVECSDPAAACSTASTPNLPVTTYYEFYYDDSEAIENSSVTVPSATTAARGVDSIRWFRNNVHTLTHGNTLSVTQKYVSTSPIDTVGSTVFAAPVSKTDLSYTGADGYPYKATMDITTNDWLIYNRYDNTATTNDFEIEFNVDKAGGDTNASFTDEGDVNPNTARRIQW